MPFSRPRKDTCCRLGVVMDENFMARALELARDGLVRGDLPIGAVVVSDDEIMTEASWRWAPERRLLAHPEAVALAAADGRSIRDLTLYTTLEPCLLCMGAAASMFVRRIVYALPSEVDGAASVFADWQPRAGHPDAGAYAVPTIEGGLCREESLALVQAYVEQGGDGGLQRWARELVG